MRTAMQVAAFLAVFLFACTPCLLASELTILPEKSLRIPVPYGKTEGLEQLRLINPSAGRLDIEATAGDIQHLPSGRKARLAFHRSGSDLYFVRIALEAGTATDLAVRISDVSVPGPFSGFIRIRTPEEAYDLEITADKTPPPPSNWSTPGTAESISLRAPLNSRAFPSSSTIQREAEFERFSSKHLWC